MLLSSWVWSRNSRILPRSSPLVPPPFSTSPHTSPQPTHHPAAGRLPLACLLPPCQRLTPPPCLPAGVPPPAPACSLPASAYCLPPLACSPASRPAGLLLSGTSLQPPAVRLQPCCLLSLTCSSSPPLACSLPPGLQIPPPACCHLWPPPTSLSSYSFGLQPTTNLQSPFDPCSHLRPPAFFSTHCAATSATSAFKRQPPSDFVFTTNLHLPPFGCSKLATILENVQIC